MNINSDFPRLQAVSRSELNDALMLELSSSTTLLTVLVVAVIIFGLKRPKTVSAFFERAFITFIVLSLGISTTAKGIHATLTDEKVVLLSEQLAERNQGFLIHYSQSEELTEVERKVAVEVLNDKYKGWSFPNVTIQKERHFGSSPN